MGRYKFLNLVKGKIKSDSGDCTWEIGKWAVPVENISMCTEGYHCSKTILDALFFVSGEVLAVVDVKGKSEIQKDKEVYESMKIAKAYKWTKKDSVALSIFSAELVLNNFEKIYPDDDRPRKAIEAAKKVLENYTEENMSAAWSAAESAWSAWSAAESAWSAWSAAESAWSARSAAESARSAARSAESAAESAWSAAESARSAAESAWSAALKKINTWLVNHINDMEEIKEVE